MLERYVKSGGEFNFGGRLYFLSEALSGYNIGLKPIASGKFEIFWGQLLVGLLEPAAADPIRLARRKKTPSQSTQHVVTGNCSEKNKILGFVEPRL